MRSFFTYILISLFILSNIHATENIKFHTLTPKGGLSYEGILDIKQDKRGFMWMLLEKNIFRFDGYTYKSYKSAFEVTNKGNFNNITCNKNGDLYLSTSNGVYKFNSLTEIFERIIETPSNYVYADNSNRIWIIHSGKISYLDDDVLVNLEFNGKKLPLNGRIVAESDKDVFFFSNFGHIYIYNKEDNLIDDFININYLFDNSKLIHAQIKANILWLITSSLDVIQIDLNNKETIKSRKNTQFSTTEVKCGYIANNNKVWIGTLNGLIIIDPETDEVEIYENKQDNKFSLPHSSVWTITEDNYNNIWLGTYGGSAAYVNQLEEIIFTTYGLSVNGLKTTPVSGFAVDDKNVWISTEGGGVNILNRKDNTFSYLTKQSGENSISGDYTKPSVIDKKGNVWIPTFRAGINMYNPHNNTFQNFRNNPDDSTSLLSNDLRTVTLEADSGLWIAYQQHSPQISYLSFNDLKAAHYSPEETLKNFTFPSSEYIYDMRRGNDGKLWLVSSVQLFSFDIKDKEFEIYDIPSAKGLNASTLCMDNEGVIWIGTLGNELISFNSQSKTFNNFTDILPSDNAEIYSINWTDEDIWMGANDGLYVFNKSSGECSVYKESDGTQGDVYYRLSTYKSDDNKLYFGGTGGFTIADALKRNINPVKPNTIISDIYLDYKSIQSNNEIDVVISNSNSLTINLKHNQQNFGFKIASDNFLNTDKNKFKYRLKNYDKQWISTDAQNRIIHYSKIPAGTYFFEFQSANNDGVWGDISSIKIIKKPAPWAGIPAWILYSVLFLSLLYYFISSYRKKKILENKLYLDQIEKEKREEIHKNQFLFFTNVSHDLKTPLALIMATINKMREEGMKEYYYKILNNNSQRLLYLLNDILDFRNLQKNRVKLSVTNSNLNEFVSKIANDFHELAKKKNFDYKIELSDDKLNHVPFDIVIMEKIVLNLLNNAFKYTDTGGAIKIQATTEEYKSKFVPSYSIIQNDDFNSQNSIKIIVSDTGVGISEESISKVFDRFYKVDTKNENKHLGTGIGLALVRELTAVHRANISICSERDKGTDFIIQFSSDIDYYKAEELKQETDDNISADMNMLDEVIIMSDDDNNNVIIEHTDNINVDKSKTILIAEDNNDLREILKSSLNMIYNVVDFEDAKQAGEFLKSEDVDMIISDIMMPGIDGITFCKNIKSNVETSHIPFILLTAKSGLESRLEGTESGADLYFEKPTDINLLKAAISNVFKQQEILRNHYASNYFADVSEIATNKEDSKFLSDVTAIIESYLDKSQLDVNTIATEMMMSRSKLYSKIKALTGKSIVEFILSYRLRKAAKLLIENNITVQEAMYSVGIESRSYFTNSFKKEFGMTPSMFIETNK